MRNIVGAVVAALILLVADAGSARLIRAVKPIHGQYIVILDRSIPAANVGGIAAELARRHGGKLRRVMTSAANGFSVTMTDEEALLLANDAGVLLVEENGYADLATSPTRDSALLRIPRRHIIAPTDSISVGQNNACLTGSGVTVYVVDTGVNRDHAQFGVSPGGTRVVDGVDFADDRDINNNPVSYPYPGQSTDVGTYPCGGFTSDMAEADPARTLNGGHGTAVASLIGGKDWGVAPGVRIVPVKVGSCPPANHASNPLVPQNIVITTESICWGLDWIRSTNNPYRDDHQIAHQPAVVNMSIWKPATDAQVDSMEYVINGLVLDNYDPAGGNRPPWDGVPVIVSANNQDTDAATTSPPRMAQGYIAGCEDRSPNPRLNNGYCSPGHVISVGATSNNVVRWDCLHAGGGEVCSSNDPGSNYGIRQTLLNGTTVVSGAVDIYAPGHDMIAASIANSIAYRITYRSGTSFAAPVVTGTVALLLQQQPTLKPTAVWDWLSQHATTFANTADPHFATVGGNLKFVQAPTCP